MFKLQGVKGDKERRELNQSLLQKSRELEQELAFNANRILLFEENQMLKKRLHEAVDILVPPPSKSLKFDLKELRNESARSSQNP